MGERGDVRVMDVASLLLVISALIGVGIVALTLATELGWTLPKRLWLEREYKRLETYDVLEDPWG